MLCDAANQAQSDGFLCALQAIMIPLFQQFTGINSVREIWSKFFSPL